MATLKEEQDRIKSLLLDTVTLLCKNGLTFKKQLKVQGLLGITLDEDNVFIVHFDESLGEITVEAQDKCPSSTSETDGAQSISRDEERSAKKSDRKRKATTELKEPEEKIQIKQESNDDVVFLEDEPDVKPMHIQALPSFPVEGMYPNYGQIPMNQPPHVLPPGAVMNTSNSATFSPNVLANTSSLSQHGPMPGLSASGFPDPSAMPQQVTPEKVGYIYLLH